MEEYNLLKIAAIKELQESANRLLAHITAAKKFSSSGYESIRDSEIQLVEHLKLLKWLMDN